MTAKEKAKELYDKYCNMESWCDDAKECALIAIEEVLHYSKLHGFIGLNEWYSEVKQEIEKL